MGEQIASILNAATFSGRGGADQRRDLLRRSFSMTYLLKPFLYSMLQCRERMLKYCMHMFHVGWSRRRAQRRFDASMNVE